MMDTDSRRVPSAEKKKDHADLIFPTDLSSTFRAMKKFYAIISFLLIVSSLSAQQVKVLFDATKAETAGNADWVIDADAFNLGPKSNGTMATGYGNEANPA